MGGSALDIGKRITINPEGNIFVVGYTSSSDFPTTSGTSSAYSTSFNGGPYDVFVSVLDKNLTTLHASTYLGGSSSDRAYSAVIDPNGNVYIAGYTSSSDFPATSNAYNTSYNQEDAFIAKLDGDLTSLTAATYLSGSAYDRVNSIAIDAEGSIYSIRLKPMASV
ncbi:MAG: SBBP repeat-containing protein [Candidatus Kuenenia sp.]|nr:SBBP repeat-containing protein [Candidatus Kuenenia sp.]